MRLGPLPLTPDSTVTEVRAGLYPTKLRPFGLLKAKGTRVSGKNLLTKVWRGMGPWGPGASILTADEMLIHVLLSLVAKQVSRAARVPPIPSLTRMPFFAWGT